jgi:putative ABC transport system permease protein
MLGNIRLLFGAIGSAIVVSILFITANTMAMAARERTTEVAILKTLGFRTRQVVGVVLGESLIVALAGGLLGCLLAGVLMPALAGAMDEIFPVFGTLRVTQGILIGALTASFAIGVLAGWFPAFQAARLRIVEGLRRVA